MKKALFLLVIQTLFITGCLNKPELPGFTPASLSVSLQYAEDIDCSERDILSIKAQLYLSTPSIAKVSEIPFNSFAGAFHFSDLYPGNWQLTITAVDNEGYNVLFNDTKVKINTGEETELTVTMQLAKATLDMAFDASRIPGIGDTITKGRVGIYFDPTTNRATYKDLSLHGTALSSVITHLQEGDFTARIVVPNATTPVFASDRFPLQLRAGRTTMIRMDPEGNVCATFPR